MGTQARSANSSRFVPAVLTAFQEGDRGREERERAAAERLSWRPPPPSRANPTRGPGSGEQDRLEPRRRVGRGAALARQHVRQLRPRQPDLAGEVLLGETAGLDLVAEGEA